ncbi:MAG: TonB-dependent receptor [Bacteroidales bacterium]|nr:TonB-dependent receptor [Bacteroidales bacterium]
MLRILFVFILASLATSIFSQFTIRGKVVDEKNLPLVGANVIIKNSLAGTVTSTSGEFELKIAREGVYTLVISYLGYETITKEMEVSSDKEIIISMVTTEYLADEVMVYGTRATSKNPIAFTNLTSEEIQSYNTGDDITYMLSVLPSVVSTSEAGIGLGYTAMRIRGSDPSRINVTMNGIPVNDSESQGVFWVDMPDFASSVDNVQVQRGVGTSTHGAGAFGATVNFQTISTPEEAYAEYNVTYGSFNTLKNTVKVGSGLISDHFSIDARLSNMRTDGYILHSGSDHSSSFISAAYHAKNTIVRFTYLDGKERTGISWWGVPQEMIDSIRNYNPAGIYYDRNGIEHYYNDQTDNYRQQHYQLHISQKLANSLTMNLAGHYTKGAGYYQQYQDDANYYHTTAFADYGLPSVQGADTITNTDLTRQKWLDNDFIGAIGSIIFKKARTETILGGGWNYYTGDHFGNILWMEHNGGTPENYEWYFNVGEKTDWNIYTKASFQATNNISLFADLQFRRIKYEMSGIDDDLVSLDQEHEFNFFNPKAGIFFDINPANSVYGSVAVANREPTRANFKDAKGDPDATPKPERLTDIEIGYTYSHMWFSATANFFYMLYDDQLVPTGEKSNVGYDIMTNVEDSYRRGVEMIVSFKPFTNFRWDLNLTLSQNKIRDFVEHSVNYRIWNEDIGWYEIEEDTAITLGETDIAYSPSITGTSNINWQIVNGLNLNLITKYVGKQYFDNTSGEDRKLDPYLINNLKISYMVPLRFAKYLELYIQINNLFNTEYINNAYGGNWYEEGNEMTWAYYYPQAGIHFYTGMRICF